MCQCQENSLRYANSISVSHKVKVHPSGSSVSNEFAVLRYVNGERNERDHEKEYGRGGYPAHAVFNLNPSKARFLEIGSINLFPCPTLVPTWV